MFRYALTEAFIGHSKWKQINLVYLYFLPESIVLFAWCQSIFYLIALVKTMSLSTKIGPS